jgi:Helitron helicase-like domain at N-terminus/PIF1-like helicase
MACIAAGYCPPVLTVAHFGSISFVSQSVMALNPFQDISCVASCAVPLPLLSISQSGFSVTTPGSVHWKSIHEGLLPSALTCVQSSFGDLPSVTALPDCQSMSQGLSIVLALTSVQSVQCHIPSSEGVLSISKCAEGTCSLMNEKHTLNPCKNNSCISDSVIIYNQPALCLYPAEFDFLDYISSENPNLVLVIRKLGVYSFIFWDFLLDLWMDLSPLLNFVLELCDKIIIANRNFMTNWRFWNSTGKNPVYLLSLSFKRNLYSKHDFVAAIRNLFKNIIAYHYRYPRYINFLRLMFQAKQKARRLRLHLFRLHRQSLPITGILKQRTRYFNAQLYRKKLSSSQKHLGGYGARIFSYQFLEPHITSNSSNISTTANFRYMDHVDNIKILEYPEGQYIHASIPLFTLFELLPVSKARKVASIHGISAGSRCNQAQLLNTVVNHSCLKCTTYSSIFVPDKNSAELHADRLIKSRKKHDQKLKSRNLSSQENIVHEFPPEISDENLCHTIISNACKKMNKDNIEEAGCAVCGELKPLKNLSRIKNIKNMLHILSTPGVTRIERRNHKSPVREYSRPVLDYTCNFVCDLCRSSIRNAKIPRLALANNLWLGKVPEELKSLRFVEKLLIARVRHTCSYVKVGSGMRKMKANIIAFESPIPKIYNILPPPRDDMDDVLAILFTGPCKPTPEDLKRTPFLVSRNHVAKALEWLKLNHSDYADIEISDKNLGQYDENSPPVSIEYRESNTNKVAEGTSVFDKEIEDGTEEGECSFSVHGLTGESLDTMTSNAIKAMALRHLNIGGKMLAVGHSDKFESMWNNPQLYPQMFPWLFPYGLGGIGTTDLSDKEHKRHLLMYHDKRFQVDINFPFVAFSHAQTKCSTTQSFLLADQRRFGDIADRLLNMDQNVLADITEKLSKGEYIKPATEAEKSCFQVIHDLDHVSGKMHGSTTSKKYMRNEIWSLINFIGAPYWYITLSPADTKHPICIYYADTQEEFKPEILPYDQRTRLVCQNPVAGARFFHFMVETFISDVLGVDAKYCGLYGDTNGYYGTVEQQGRLTLHLHMLIWILGSLNPQEMREKIMSSNSEWKKKLISWLENCHTGDFLTGTHADISERAAENAQSDNYSDPTETMPEPPPPKCSNAHNTDENSCKRCKNLDSWWSRFKNTVDDLLLRSNIHTCERGQNKDGTRRKGKPSASCKDNKWGKCKARFPRPTFLKSIIDDTGSITMKKIEPWLNTFTPLVTYLFRCNTDVTSLSSGTAIKAVVIYVSDYITKTTLKTHTIFDSIRSVFHKNGEMIGGTLPMQEKARRIMTKIVNLLSAKAEMGSPMICMYLLGNPDHYTSHTFVPFYWQSFVTQVRQDFDEDEQEVQKITLIKKKGKIVGLSPVYDYIYRSPDLEDVCLYDWVQRFQRKKVKKPKSESCSTAETNELIDADCDISFESVSEKNDIKKAQSTFHFTEKHSLHDSHASHLISNFEKRVPNFIGANLPRCDQGDREYYCCTMLTLFKPWRRGRDLKESLQASWDGTFNEHEFRSQEVQLMKNFNIRYECLDARDDYRAQLKNGIDKSLIGSWEVFEDENGHEMESFQRTTETEIIYDDIPVDPKAHGKNFLLRLKNMDMMRMILTDNGWIDAKSSSASQLSNTFKPDRVLSSHEWEVEVKKMKQKILDKRNENNKFISDVDSKQTSSNFKENIVKIVDKSYLEKSFVAGEHANKIDETVLKFELNKEQERAFRIVANHSVSPHQDQLKMYLGGMGGTGKSRVLAALSHFFTLQKEAHRFVIVAPTGSAAALLGGSTYHSMFGINDFNSNSQLSQVKANLAGVEYVFFDEVSMLSARDLYRINNQLSKVFNTPEDSFGGLNMVFSGDFAQLPPAVGGEGVSLYSQSIGTIASSMKSQEEAIGKALWHQVTTVVILRQNMRQKKQSALDNQLRTALENMRYKACTPEDIRFLRTRISSNLPNRPSVCDDIFRNVSIITAKNLHKDEINRLGAIRFAQETGQKLTNFCSEDSTNVRNNEKKTSGALRIKEITDEIQMSLWSQPPSSTDKHIAGSLSLCIGLPVMIRYNFATELCMTRGQEGYIHGWQSRIGKKNQLILDTLFIKLKNPPSEVQFEGLPLNVVPVYPTTNNIYASLPNDDRILIARTQVEVLVNFAMTDFGSQGKTRPENVPDLNNLQTHQSYYTALSRSASAEGTLILQGFDPRKITGKCSGALRQEFRELEILDEITRLRYEGKLSVKVYGDIRNTLIKTFREWKSQQYVPNTVHSAIRWSKHDPLFESEIIDIKKIRSSMNSENKTKRKMDENVSTVSSKQTKLKTMTENVDPESKKICLSRPPSDGSNHYLIPQGMIWSNNSCAYDSIFTILFSIWCDNKKLWTYNFHRMNNPFIIALSNGFNDVDNNRKDLGNNPR